MSELLVVSQQPRSASDRGDQQVEVSVAVDIGEAGASSDHRIDEVLAALIRFECHEFVVVLGSAVPEQLRRLLVVLARLHQVDVGFEVSIGGEDIESSIEIAVEEEDTEGQFGSSGYSDAIGDGFILEHRQLVGECFADIQRGGFVGEVPDGDAQYIGVAEAADVDSHRASSIAVGIKRDSRLAAFFSKRAVSVAQEQEVADGVVGDDQVDVTIVVEIGEGDPQRLGEFHVGPVVADLDPRLFGDVVKGAVAVVEVEVGGAAGELLWLAVGA